MPGFKICSSFVQKRTAQNLQNKNDQFNIIATLFNAIFKYYSLLIINPYSAYSGRTELITFKRATGTEEIVDYKNLTPKILIKGTQS